MTPSTHDFPAVIALREALGADFVESVRDKLRLRDTPFSFVRRGSTTLILLYAARCGSTFASQLLSNLPTVGHMTEWFQPEALDKRRGRETAESDEALIQSVLDEAGDGVFATKSLPRSIVAAALMGYLDQYRDGLTFVMLRRRDDVAQAVSLFKGRLSGRFHTNPEPDQQPIDTDFDFPTIAAHRTVITRVYALQDAILEALGQTAPTVYYEDIKADPRGFVEQVAAIIDLPVPQDLSVDTRIKPVGDALNLRWIERFREIEAERG